MWWFLRETKTWHYSCISDWDWVTLEFKLFHFVTPILLQWGQISSFIHALNINRPPFELQTFSQWRKMVRSSYTPPARNKQAHVAQITCCDPRDPPPPDLSQTKDSISGSSSSSPGSEALSRIWDQVGDTIWYPAAVVNSNDIIRRQRAVNSIQTSSTIGSSHILLESFPSLADDHSDDVWSSPEHIS